MGISYIEIKNCKSLLNINVDINSLTCLIGENGTGKSNFLKAISYFYENLTEINNESNLHDLNNPFSPFMEITIYFDFTNLLTISDNQFFAKFPFESDDLNPLFKKILSLRENGLLDKNNLLKVTLREYKNREILWNISYDLRAFVKHMFPLYIVNTRDINLTDWYNIWGVIGNLSKLNTHNKKKFDVDLEALLSGTFGKNYTKVVNSVRSILQDNNLRIESSSTSDMFGTLYQLQLGGVKFKYKNEELNLFSDGINSLNYLKLLISVVNKIAISKLMEPTILIDEPEISLYPKYLDEIAEVICSKPKKVNIFIVTHSPRLVKNIINSGVKNSIYHSIILNNYTSFKKMSSFDDPKQRFNLTELEASYYFSKGIVILEGISDLYVLKNKNVISLFPWLKQLDFYTLDSNTINLQLIHPDNKKIKIPYLVVLDLDQIIDYVDPKFVLYSKSKWFNPLKDKKTFKREIYTFGQRRINTYHTNKRIKGIITHCHFTFNPDWGNTTDPLFYTLRTLIKEYCINYNIFLFNNTIEGALINGSNYNDVMIWFSTNFPRQKSIFDAFNLKDEKEKLILLRLFFSGKFDNLNTLDEQYGKNESKLTDMQKAQKVKDLRNNLVGKTSGWIDSLLDYIFEKNINHLPTVSDKIKIFREAFPELNNLISHINTKLIK